MAALHVDDLDELAGLDLVGLGRTGRDTPVDAGVREGLRHRVLDGRSWVGAGDKDLDRRWRILPVDAHRGPRRRHEADKRPFGGQGCFVARARVAAKNIGRPRRSDIQTAPLKGAGERPGCPVIAAQDRLQAFGGSVHGKAQRLRVGRAVRGECGKLGGLSALPVANRDSVARFQREDGCRAALGNVPLDPEAQRRHPWKQYGAGGRGPLRECRLACFVGHHSPNTLLALPGPRRKVSGPGNAIPPRGRTGNTITNHYRPFVAGDGPGFCRRRTAGRPAPRCAKTAPALCMARTARSRRRPTKPEFLHLVRGHDLLRPLGHDGLHRR